MKAGQRLFGAVGLVVLVAGCSDLTPGQQRAVTGTGIGAAGGAVLGAIGGNAGLGAAAGAGAGLLGGLLFNEYKQSQDTAYQQGVAAGQRKAAAKPPPPPPSPPPSPSAD
jgi:hypothetical protein